VINGELYIGGDFDWYNGVTKLNGVAKWNGETWEPLGSGFGETGSTYIYDFEYFEGELYAAGAFRKTGEGGVIYNVAKWNGVYWECVGNGLRTIYSGGVVSRLIVFEGELYAAGLFDESGTTDLKNIAKWDGEKWIPDGFFDDRVKDLQVVNDQLVAIGDFSTYIDSINTTLPSDLFIGDYELTQLNISNSVSGKFGNGYLFNTNSDPVQINISDKASNPFIEGTPRSFSVGYLPTFGGFSIDFTMGFNEDSTIGISFVRAPISCGIGITFDGAEDSFGAYDPSDDSKFTFAIVENTSLDCEAPADTIRFEANKLVSKRKSNLKTMNGVAVKANGTWQAVNNNLASFNSSAIFNNELYLFGNFLYIRR
jgi:hypothetical protein